MTELCEVVAVVNGTQRRGEVEARMLLADYLRDVLGLTGTHLGCEHGVCGACTVLIDGRSARSCLMFAVQANGHEITTVEGLSSGGELSLIQETFSRHHALQCGFCTPGFLIAVFELIQTPVDMDEAQIRAAMAGNLCRCTGYHNIVGAVRELIDNATAKCQM